MVYQIAIQAEKAMIEAIKTGTEFTTIGYIDGKIHVRLNGFWNIL